MEPALDDEALYEGWCAIGQPNAYRGPKQQELADLAEGKGGKHFRRGVLAKQVRLRDERKRLRRSRACGTAWLCALHMAMRDLLRPPAGGHCPSGHAARQKHRHRHGPHHYRRHRLATAVATTLLPGKNPTHIGKTPHLSPGPGSLRRA